MSELYIGRLLGASKISEVYHVTRNNRNYALKSLLSPKHRYIIKREFECLRTLHHSNIVKVHDWIEDFNNSGSPAFTMTHLHGVNGKVLAERLQRLPTVERHKRIVQIGVQLCSALQHIHEKGWLHRDIKPSNLMFEQETQVLLIDFGTVTPYPHKHRENGLIGTPRYASPEQLSGDILTPSCDQFSLGATLYYLLLNEPAFSSRNRSTPLRPSLLDPSIPVHLESILMRCMRIDPTERFDSIQEMITSLHRVQPLDQPLAGREGLIQQIGHCLQRVHLGEQLHVHFKGTRGSGKTWARETLCHAAKQQGLTYRTIHSPDEIEDVLNTLALRQSLIVCSGNFYLPQLGIATVIIEVSWLSLSELRRSLFSHAPTTPALNATAQWLYEQTSGIPALLLPMLLDYTIRDAFHIPQNPELQLPKEWFNNVEETHWKILQRLSYSPQGVLFEVLSQDMESVDLIVMTWLEERSLVIQQGSLWKTSCSLVVKFVQHQHPANRDQLHQWTKPTSSTPFLQSSSNEAKHPLSRSIHEIDMISAQGQLSHAKNQGIQLLEQLEYVDRADCLVQIGQVQLDIGNHMEATLLLADATALSNVQTSQHTYLRSQALRARASLEQHNGSPIGAMHALDRLAKLTKYKDPWVTSVWHWAIGALGDHRQWHKHLEAALIQIQNTNTHHRIRCTFNLLRGACAIGDLTAATHIMNHVHSDLTPFPLLEWEIHRVQSLLQNKIPPKIGPLAYGLTAEEIFLFKKRWVRVKGKHPDPTWHH